MTRTVTIVAKAPSAVHAQKWIDACRHTDVATINEAGLVLRKTQQIRFGFFVHAGFVSRMRPLWGRIDCFVSPADLIGPNELPAGFPRHKHIRYAGNTCGGSRADMLARLKAGFVVHNHTMTAAMSWLAKMGYKCIRIIGTGGQGYAKRFAGKPKLPNDLMMWPRIETTLAQLLKELYGTAVERFR